MNSFEIVNIEVKFDDIFKYVVGNSQYCPIERNIDSNRYSAYDEFIYDNFEKDIIDQSEDYENFSTQVSLLRSKASGMKLDEILRVCEEIQEIAPKTIKL
jgi:hypothetical protein